MHPLYRIHKQKCARDLLCSLGITTGENIFFKHNMMKIIFQVLLDKLNYLIVTDKNTA